MKKNLELIFLLMVFLPCLSFGQEYIELKGKVLLANSNKKPLEGVIIKYKGAASDKESISNLNGDFKLKFPKRLLNTEAKYEEISKEGYLLLCKENFVKIKINPSGKFEPNIVLMSKTDYENKKNNTQNSLQSIQNKIQSNYEEKLNGLRADSGSIKTLKLRRQEQKLINQRQKKEELLLEITERIVELNTDDASPEEIEFISIFNEQEIDAALVFLQDIGNKITMFEKSGNPEDIEEAKRLKKLDPFLRLIDIHEFKISDDDVDEY